MPKTTVLLQVGGMEPYCHVEKVFVFKAKDIGFDKTTIPKGGSVNAKLPVDAQVWLSLQPISTRSCTNSVEMNDPLTGKH
jgi:hypothetical protein